MKVDCRALTYETTSLDKNVPIIKIFVLYGASVKSLNLIQYMKETITQKEKMKKSLYATSLGDRRRNVYQILDLEKRCRKQHGGLKENKIAMIIDRDIPRGSKALGKVLEIFSFTAVKV